MRDAAEDPDLISESFRLKVTMPFLLISLPVSIGAVGTLVTLWPGEGWAWRSVSVAMALLASSGTVLGVTMVMDKRLSTLPWRRMLAVSVVPALTFGLAVARDQML
ncbi:MULTISPECIES: hypothetical protein [Actinoplanes]|uniref:hypothetical protein n=1 Tax=Actinoplanes TaxID=1865 RepID=UPI0005F2B2A2|nr:MULTISPECIES: hypothetical protein [Actinoplanes]GLY03838.1 hypothetical protein Acsp01_42170 [Actinoplanes sp. NBRC 101535]